MSNDSNMTRRSLMMAGLSASAILAGCSSQSNSSPDTTAETTSAKTTTETTATETTTTEATSPKPTIDEFEYPDGASKTGITASKLYATHRSSITDAGSVSVETKETHETADYSTTITLQNSWSGAGLKRVMEREDIKSTLWSPASEGRGYVQMNTGFEQRYRIDTEVPGPERLLKLTVIKALLQGVKWSEANEVVELGDETYGVRFEATGVSDKRQLSQAVYAEQFTDVTADITVTESGYLNNVSYDITASRNGEEFQQTDTINVGTPGEATVKAPQWEDTARQNGYLFTAEPTDDQKAIKVEMKNGGSIPSGTSVNLSSSQHGFKPLEQEMAVGDTLYLSLSADGNLLIDSDGVPSDATKLKDFAFISIRDNQFKLFEDQFQL